MSHFEKFFSIGEARELLPGVRALLLRVHRLLSEPVVIEMGGGEMRPVSSSSERALSFFSEGPSAQRLSLGELPLPQSVEGRHGEANKILMSLVDKGIVIQDVRRGLVDFPHLLHGEQEVLLCYELADGGELNWYHDLSSGYAGRQPIPPQDA